jgi:ADP-ribose pyrophosphatase
LSDADDPLAEQTLDSRLAFEGVFLRLFVNRVRTADGHESTREYLRHPGAVMMIPLLDDGQVVLERQFRYPLARNFVEFPAGKIDAGEELLACAQRELREETGYVARAWTHLGGFHNAIAYSDEKIEVFLAQGLSHEGANVDAGEVLEVFIAPLQKLHSWIADGSITDVKTIVGVYWLERFLKGQPTGAGR